MVRLSLYWVNMMRCVARGRGQQACRYTGHYLVSRRPQPPSPARPRLHFPALICLTISGHFTHTQSTYNHKKWKLIKHNKSGSYHIFTFANTLTNTQSTAWWSHLCVWSGVVLGSSGGVGLCNVSRCWTVSHRGTCLSYNWLSGLCWRHNKNV